MRMSNPYLASTTSRSIPRYNACLGVLAFWQNTFKRIFPRVWTCLDMFGLFTPLKINGWNLNIHPIEKENHLNQTFIFCGPILIFPGCTCVLFWRATLILCFFSGHVIIFFLTIEVKGITGLHLLRMPSIWFLSPYDYAQRPYEILSGKTMHQLAMRLYEIDPYKTIQNSSVWRFLHFSKIPQLLNLSTFWYNPAVVPNRKM